MYLLKTENLLSNIGAFLLLFFFTFQQTNATTYYVDSSGSDGSGNGSASKPWKTLLHASWQVDKAGDVIYLKPGKYYETGRIIHIKPGVSVKGAGIDKTVIFSDEDVAIIFLSQPVANGNQTISDLTMDGKNKTKGVGIRIEGRHNVTVERVKFKDYKTTGLDVSSFNASKDSPPSTYLRGIKILNNIFINCAADLNGRSTGALQVGNMEGGEVAYNTINENTGYGLKFTAWGWFKSTKFHHNTITTPRHDKHWTSDIAIELWNLYDNCEVYSNITNNWFSFVRGNKGKGSHSVRIYDNQIIMPEVSGGNFMEAMEIWLSDVEIYNNYMENFREGIGIWGDFSLSNIKIYKNVMYSKYSLAKGVLVQPFKSLVFNNIEIYNNTIEVGGAAFTLRSKNSNFTVKNVKINNNLVIKAEDGVTLNGKGGSLRIENLKITHNNFYQVGGYLLQTSTNLVGPDIAKEKNMFDNPQLQLSGKRNGDYYELKAGSGSIDAGIKVGLSYLGTAPDCGGKEHEGGGTGSTNNSLIAKAGSDQTLTDSDGNGVEKVILDGSGSSDSDGTISSYQWSENGKVIASGVKPSVTLAVGTHEIMLKVTDNDGNTNTDQLTIQISSSGEGGSSGQGDAVVSFTLIDAITDQPISAYDPIPNGAAINLANLPHKEVNIRVNANIAKIKNIAFQLTGAAGHKNTEGVAPYALFGDINGNYKSWVPKSGSYTLTATINLQNGDRQTKVVSFSITNSAARLSQVSVEEDSKKATMWQSTENANHPSFAPKDNALEWMIGNASQLENCRLQFVNRLGQLLYQINQPSVEDVKDLLGKITQGKEYYYILQCGDKVVKSGGIIKAH